MSLNPRTGSGVLLGVALALALQIPTTIAAIPDTATRGVIQVFTLIAVVVCATLVRPREVASMMVESAQRVVNSIRPPPAKFPQGERVSILPPRTPEIETSGLHGFELEEDPHPSGLETQAVSLPPRRYPASMVDLDEKETPTVPPPEAKPTPRATPNAKAVARAQTDPPKGGTPPAA